MEFKNLPGILTKALIEFSQSKSLLIVLEHFTILAAEEDGIIGPGITFKRLEDFTLPKIIHTLELITYANQYQQNDITELRDMNNSILILRLLKQQ